MAKDFIIAGTDSVGRPAVLCGLDHTPRGEDFAVSLPADAINTSIYDRPLFFASEKLAKDYLAKFQKAGVNFEALQSPHIFPISRCACGFLKVDPAGTDPEPYKCKKCQRKDSKK